jgi:hypothetical protein
LILDISVEAQGLNDKTTVQTIVIPREKIIDASKTASELAKEIASSLGKDYDIFRMQVEAKIIWLRFIKDEKSLSDATLVLPNSIYVACKDTFIFN